MNAYLVPVNDPGSQNECLQTLKSNGIEVIQSANGLCLKTNLSGDEVKGLVGRPVKPISPSDEDLSEDVKKFIAG